jgi:hypothetical protein
VRPRTTTTLILACLAALALSAAATAAAQAAGGPVWKTVNRDVLGSLASRQVKSTNKLSSTVTSTFTLNGTTNIDCKKVTNYGTLIGRDPGTDAATIIFEECAAAGDTVAQCGIKGVKPEPAANNGEVIVAVKTVLVYPLGHSGSTTEADDAFVPEGEGAEPSAANNLFVEFEFPATDTCGLKGTKVEVKAAGTEINAASAPFKRKCGLVAEVGEIAAGAFARTTSGTLVTPGGLKFPGVAIKEVELWNGAAFETIKCELKALGAATEVGTEKQETVGPEAFGWEI